MSGFDIDALAEAIEAGRKSLSGPVIGDPEKPYQLYVPRWYEDRCIAQGTTAQEIANATIRYAVEVHVVEEWSG